MFFFFFPRKVYASQMYSGFPHRFNLILLSVKEKLSEELPQVCVTLNVECLLLLSDYKKTRIQSTDFFTQVGRWEWSHIMRMLRHFDGRHDEENISFSKLFCECALKQHFFVVWGCRYTIILFHLNTGNLLPKDMNFKIFILFLLICTILKVHLIYFACNDSVYTSWRILCASIRKKRQLVLYRRRVAVFVRILRNT
jgi:hypothetical protein